MTSVRTYGEYVELDVAGLEETVARLEGKFDDPFDKLDGKVAGLDRPARGTSASP